MGHRMLLTLEPSAMAVRCAVTSLLSPIDGGCFLWFLSARRPDFSPHRCTFPVAAEISGSIPGVCANTNILEGA